MAQHVPSSSETVPGGQPPLESKIEFAHLLTRLKTQKRTGWVRVGVRDPESIADHIQRVATLALLSEDASLDINRCVALATVHDMVEAQTGDLVIGQDVSKEEKARMEAEAMEGLLTRFLAADSLPSKRIRALWREYEERETPEARFVKDLDLFELGLQGMEYEKDQGLQLQEFFESTQPRIRSSEVRSWSRTLMRERRAHWSGQVDPSGYSHVEVPNDDSS